MDGDEKKDEPDYDNMSEEDYFREMEMKVEYYKQAYPDMYEKAVQWIKMLEHSELYKQNSGDSEKPAEETEGYLNATDILKNMNYYGITEEDLSESDLKKLNAYIPDWKTKIM